MNKVKKWVPPVAPIRNDVTVWRAICQDIHDNFIEAGLVQTDDTGQLDIDSVVEMPANNIEVGYRVYRWNDAAQATSPIFMRVGFRTGFLGSAWNGYTLSPKISTQFSTSTDGSGNMTGPSWIHPRDDTTTSQNAPILTPGVSYFSRNDDLGFFGFVYAAKAIDGRANNNYKVFSGLACMFVQRDPQGGFSVLGTWNNLSNTTSTNHRNLQYGPGYSFINPDGTFTNMTRTAASRPFAAEEFNPEDGINFAPVYRFNTDRTIEQWPSLVTYHSDTLPPGAEFDLEVVDGETKNFITLGDEVGVGVDQLTFGHHSFAMVWEDG